MYGARPRIGVRPRFMEAKKSGGGQGKGEEGAAWMPFTMSVCVCVSLLGCLGRSCCPLPSPRSCSRNGPPPSALVSCTRANQPQSASSVCRGKGERSKSGGEERRGKERYTEGGRRNKDRGEGRGGGGKVGEKRLPPAATVAVPPPVCAGARRGQNKE
ncbi:hypothetical protein H696_04958 [Fonticula alba]|uniref:Uncharacterized protein n=1 Tax=Fonticula alba TaxID=691883 RepID=A0A058Z567_FONAL|nr:hypothetical protein H696_04958 [Fonticula alba]KCV68667.1 hypothetical protein H696_04958 [Fonticula alba]|eukprot:XP_009497099.1 hypothetical protein H696_04958 [Fonticula alba]